MKNSGRLIILFALAIALLLPVCAGAEDGSREVRLEANQTQLITGDDCWLHCYAPEADEAILYRSDEKAQDAVHEQWPMGVNFDSYVFAQEASVMTFRLSARFGEEWVEAPLLTVHMDAPNGKMPAPVIHAEKQYPQGQDVRFTVETVEKLITYEVTVFDEKGEQFYHTDYIYDREFAVASEAMPKGTYTIRAEAEGYGYYGVGRAEFTFRLGETDTPLPVDEPADPKYTATAQFNAEELLLTGNTAHTEGTAEAEQLFVRITYFMAGGNYTVVSTPVSDDGSYESMFSGNVVHIAVQVVDSARIKPGTYTRYGGYEFDVE